MDIVLIAGLWLRRSVWDDVSGELQRLGHRPIAVALPGADDGSDAATLGDQVAAVVGAVDAAERPMVVAHSAASTLGWIAADQRPQTVDRVVMIGGFPATDGGTYADIFPVVDGVMPFPGWAPFEGPDSVDLDESARSRIAADAVAVPEAVARGVVRLADERRFDVPVLVVCPEFSPEDAKGWIDAGDLPELRRAADLSFADIDSGHWPMMTRPTELAALLDGAARAA
jgi:pimeloyl-ACP methyl ester carboxylesterase